MNDPIRESDDSGSAPIQNSCDARPRVGVYVCHCGGNISDVVDVKAVADALGVDEKVVVAREYPFMCSDPGQKLILEDIENKGIDRVVVAACSPTLHELTFRKALERGNLNPYLYEHVNIREQCAWVHKSDHAGATEKAIRLTRAGMEKVARQDPLEAMRVKATKRVAVIGGGVAGMTAAAALARQGLEVVLVEKRDSLGGRVTELATVYPTGESASDLLNDLRSELANQPLITVHLRSEIAAVEGYVGNFSLRIRSFDEQGAALDHFEITAGAIVMATGFNHYQPTTDDFDYGVSPFTLTLAEFNQFLADHPKASALRYQGREIKSIAFIHCVGSRQTEGIHTPGPDGRVNDYCSRVCCSATLHAINAALDRFPNLNVFDLYRDIRTYGRGHEDLYESASKKGALFFRYDDDGAPQLDIHASKGETRSITMTDVLTWKEEVTIPTDMIVLATGMTPRDISGLVAMMKLPTGSDRFLQEVHPKLRPVELANNGIVVAGTCQGPMDINEACAAAEAAASKVAILLANPTLELDPFVAEVEDAKCDGCEACIEECSYTGALMMREKEGRQVAEVNPALCAGCGACGAVCQPRAIRLAGWTLDQFDAMVDAITLDRDLSPA
jgi:heterodisulfide reductase subunit A